MRIAFFSTKPYDRIWFEPMGKDYGYDMHFIEAPFNEETVSLAKGHDAVCIFVNDSVTAGKIDQMCGMGIKALLLRSAGFNHVDIHAAKGRIPVLRVPSYSPEAVAEYAMAMLLTVNRYTHKAYNRTRDFNMNINGFIGTDLNHKVAGVVGTGKIGQAMIRIFKGFNMQVLAYDPYPNTNLDVRYVSLEELMEKSDFISLHCPLTESTRYIVNRDTIALMKEGVYLVNTSRGALVDTEALIEGHKNGKFRGVGLDVYEEEEGLFFEDKSTEIMQDENLARLMTFPNVLVTSHMGFFTVEAMQAIATETLENAYAVEHGLPLKNLVE